MLVPVVQAIKLALDDVEVGPLHTLRHAEARNGFDRDLEDDSRRPDAPDRRAEEVVPGRDVMCVAATVHDAEPDDVLAHETPGSTRAVHVGREDAGNALGVVRGQRGKRPALARQSRNDVSHPGAATHRQAAPVRIAMNDTRIAVQRDEHLATHDAAVERVPRTADTDPS